jgi:hypothetical protein
MRILHPLKPSEGRVYNEDVAFFVMPQDFSLDRLLAGRR